LQEYEINGNTFYTIIQDKKRAPTKTVVSLLIQQTRMGKRTRVTAT
jgi:hypothetical protein